jgi:hypothetical protein
VYVVAYSGLFDLKGFPGDGMQSSALSNGATQQLFLSDFTGDHRGQLPCLTYPLFWRTEMTLHAFCKLKSASRRRSSNTRLSPL